MSTAPVRRRILLSAYACSPQWGSETGVGWQWLLQLARSHDVVLLTHAYFREHLEPALADAGVQVEVEYFQAPAFGTHPHRQLNSRLYYTWWQWRLRGFVKRLVARRRFDLIHHLTWGTLRFPCWLGGLGVPLVMGPLGGGESAPMRLFAGLPLRLKVFDYLRAVSLLWVRVDPLAGWGPRRSVLVLCRTMESLGALPLSVQHRAVVVPDIGSPEVDLSHRTVDAAAFDCGGQRRLQLLFAGRLLAWKGVALALGAVARLVQAGHAVELTIAGDGPMRGYLAEQVDRLGLQGHVRLLGSIPRDELLVIYGQAHLFLFPSLHDAGGTVVLEALSRGLPVICLDLGGPPNFVNPGCGAVVSTLGRSRDEVERALADVVAGVLADPGKLPAWSAGAVEQARRHSWEKLVQRAYAHIGRQLGWPALAS